MKFHLKDSQQLMVVRATDISTIAGVPTEIQIAPFGQWKGYKDGKGNLIEFKIDRQIAEQAVAYHRQLKEFFPDRDLVIDYEHQTSDDEIAPAAGWLHSDIYLKEDGIYGRVKSWTKRAEEFIRNKEYRYLSPVLLFNDVDKTTGERIPLRVKNIALTNEPFLDQIKPITAKDNAETTIIYLTDPNHISKGDTTMLEQILALFKLDPKSTFDQVKVKFDEIVNGAAAIAAKYKTAMTELGLKEDASADDVKAFALKHNTILQELGLKATDTIDAIKQVIVAAKDNKSQQIDLKDYVKKSEFEALNLQLKERDANEIIAKHVQRGAVEPNEVEDFKADVKNNRIELKDLDTRLAKRADNSRVPVQEIDAKHKREAGGAIDATVLEIAGKAGVSKEDLEKYGKL
jgi:phage I-like protein